MAKSSSTGSGASKGSAAKSGGSKRKPAAKSSAKQSASGGKPQAKARPAGGSQSSAADALIKLLESPLVAEILALGASAALASLAAQRFGRSEDGKGTRRALKTAAKAAAAAMGQRLASEVEEIRKASKPRADEAE